MITNLKSYIKKGFKKFKLSILPITITSVILTGCNLKKEVSYDDTKTTSISNVESTTDSYIDNNINDKIDEDVLDETLNLDNDDLESIASSLNELDYLYSDYFNIDEAFNLYSNYEEKGIESNFIITDNKIDSNKLYNIVLKNNKNYLKEGTNSNIYNEFSDSKILEICNVISTILNEEINENTNIEELDNNLYNLKILEYSDYYYASVTTDDVLAINTSLINTLNIKDPLKKIITHESVHLLQRGNDNLNVDGIKNTGINYKFDELSVNPLYNQWFIEASCEKVASKYNGAEILYTNEMYYLDILNIISSLDGKEIEYINFERNLNKFYEEFNCDNNISNKEIALMMYSIGFVVNDDTSFLKEYEKENKISFDYSSVKELKDEYKNSIFTTLSKIFYYKLTNKLVNNELSIQQIFDYMQLFEVSIANLNWYPVKYDENEYFIKEYYDLQKNLLSVISKKVNCSEEELEILYNYYFNNYDIDINSNMNKIYEKVKHNKKSTIITTFNEKIDKNCNKG